MGGEQFDIEAGGEHVYLIHVHDPDDEITIKLRLSEEAARELDVEGTHEGQIAAATVRYLLSRQEAFDLPGELDFEDIIVAYAGFTEVIRREVGQASSTGSLRHVIAIGRNRQSRARPGSRQPAANQRRSAVTTRSWTSIATAPAPT